MNGSNERPLVSVLTPVYNGETYIRECIESVLGQNYQNWVYTIVNNCSTDGTLEIAQEYASKDPRISIVNNAQFYRVIANHNVAMRCISPDSKYCKVVFADDWLFPECLEKMVSLAEQNPSVGIVGSYRLYGDTIRSDGPPYGRCVVTGREICRAAMLQGIFPFGTATSLLIRADLVRSHIPFYNESNIHADSEVCFELLKDCDFGFVHQVLTFTRLQAGTMTSVSRGKRTLLGGVLSDIVNFGPYYLEPEERKSVLESHLRLYYRLLGQFVFERRGKAFWDFHKEKLREAGYPLDRLRVSAQAVRYALDVGLALNAWPYAFFRRAWQKLRAGLRKAEQGERTFKKESVSNR